MFSSACTKSVSLNCHNSSACQGAAVAKRSTNLKGVFTRKSLPAPKGATPTPSGRQTVSLIRACSAGRSDSTLSSPTQHRVKLPTQYAKRTSKLIACAASTAGSEVPSDESDSSSSNSGNETNDRLNLYRVIGITLVSVAGLCFGVQKAMFLDNAAFAAVSAAFTMAFSIIFVSELGDKTFFIAGLLAMRQNKLLVLSGTMGALGLMTVISVAIGVAFQKVPAILSSNGLQYAGNYMSAAALVYFGVTILRDAYSLPNKEDREKMDSGMSGELADAEEIVENNASSVQQSPWKVLVETFSLIFVAEWGDRSMLATIALGAGHPALGVAAGAIAGHFAASIIAVLGGAILAKYISERTVGYIGGTLFLVFAAATVMGIF